MSRFSQLILSSIGATRRPRRNKPGVGQLRATLTAMVSLQNAVSLSLSLSGLAPWANGPTSPTAHAAHSRFWRNIQSVSRTDMQKLKAKSARRRRRMLCLERNFRGLIIPCQGWTLQNACRELYIFSRAKRFLHRERSQKKRSRLCKTIAAPRYLRLLFPQWRLHNALFTENAQRECLLSRSWYFKCVFEYTNILHALHYINEMHSASRVAGMLFSAPRLLLVTT